MNPTARLVVRLTPRAALDRIDGWDADARGRPVLKVRTTAPATEGRANAALERLIACALGVSPSAVRLTSGASARVKTLQISGADQAFIRAKLTPRPS